MCGITGIFHKNKLVDSLQLKSITDSISHRGPDDYGYFAEGSIGLGHRRLSILDLSPLGHQPMHSHDGRYVIVFNGEIYNYLELKAELINTGYVFKSSSDTEVLLNAYIEWGANCLDKFNGMWAFIIYDKLNKTAFISRDRFGVKPLYYYKNCETIIFGSEIKSILSSGIYAIQYNDKILAEYLYQGKIDTGNDTFFQEIYSVTPGSYLIIDSNRHITEKIFWKISHDRISGSEDELADQYFSLFEDSVRLRMRSDVPVGVCLSGGLDSTSIICSMNRIQKKLNAVERIEAFAYTDKDYCEKKYLEDTMCHVNSRLNMMSSEPEDLWNTIDTLMGFHDEPVHSMTAIVGFKLFKLIKNSGIKVILNGQGADESLAGYSSYFERYWLSLLSNGKFKQLDDEIDKYCRAFSVDKGTKIKGVVTAYLKQKLKIFPVYRYLSSRRYENDIQRDRYIQYQVSSNMFDLVNSYDRKNLFDDLKSSIENSPLPLYLRVEDRNSMANSTEARLPFMDYRLINMAFSLPDNMKLRGPYNKYLLRKAMTGKIPASVSERLDKMGFPTSFSNWTSNILKKPVLERLYQISPRSRELFRVENFITDINDGTLSEDGNRKLFRLFQIESMFKNAERYANHGSQSA